jgi:hypothetical protein
MLPPPKRLWLMLAGIFMISAGCPSHESGKEDAGSHPTASIGMLSWNSLGSRVGPAVATGNLLNAANESTPPCGVSSPKGSDMTYQWTAPVTGLYTFTTEAKDFDTILSIYDSTGELLGCNADKSSALVLEMAANAVFRITVDEATPTPNAQAAFTLNVCSPLLCNAPPGDKGCFNAGTCAFNGACTYSPKPAGTSCDDGLSSTTHDKCDSSGHCRGDTVCTQDGTRCWDSTTRAVCRNGILVPQSCATGQQCANNSCAVPPCPSGSSRCGELSCCGPDEKCCLVNDVRFCRSRGESCQLGPVP